MLTASEYRKRNRKTITLPSGGEIEIRKLAVKDFLQAGDVPTAFFDPPSEERTEALKKDSAFGRAFIKVCMTAGVVSMKIVDKPPSECAEDEVPVDEVPPVDAKFIMDEVSALTNMTAEAGKTIRRFQAEQEAPSLDSLGGEDLRKAAVGDPGPAD